MLALLWVGVPPACAEPAAVIPDPRLEVEISNLEDGAAFKDQTLTLQVIVRAAAGVTVRLHPIINGHRLPQDTRGLVVKSEKEMQADGGPLRQREFLRSLTVQLPAENCTVAVLAETPTATRTSAPVRLNWQGRPAFVVKPKLYLLAVGISAYRDSDLTLRYPSKDANDFAQAMLLQQGGLYEQVSAQVLLDGQATRDHILDGLQWLQRQTTAKDVAILFLAGHGIDDPSSGVYYFLPHDADHQAVMRSMISQQSLQTVLRSIPGKTLLFLDTCHAASVMNGASGRSVADVSRLLKELSSVENGLLVYAAASGRQLSQESPLWNNGVFTKAVVEGLLGRAAYHTDRPITTQMLNLYVSERVKELTAGTQTPIMVTLNPLADFPLALALPKQPAPPSSPPLPLYEPLRLPPVAAGPPPPEPPPYPAVLPQPLQSKRTLSISEPARSTPVYRKAWFWLAIGGAAAVVGGLAAYGATAASSMTGPTSTSPGDGSVLTFMKVE